MSFFENPKAMELAQAHISEVASLEEKEAKTLLRSYKRVRQDLVDRLDSLPENSFSAQRLRVVLLQIDAAIDAMKTGLLDDFRESGDKVALLGPKHLIREVTKYERMFTGTMTPIDIDSVIIAQDTSSFLFNRYQSSIDAYSGDVRNQLYRGLSDAVLEGANSSEVTRRLNRFFLGEEWKLERLARTELHHIYGMSKQKSLEGALETVPDLMKTLIHPMDNRTGDDSKQADRQNLIVEVNKPFEYTYSRRLASGQIRNEKRVFMVPPDRPNDRSIMVPYRAEWEK